MELPNNWADKLAAQAHQQQEDKEARRRGNVERAQKELEVKQDQLNHVGQLFKTIPRGLNEIAKSAKSPVVFEEWLLGRPIPLGVPRQGDGTTTPWILVKKGSSESVIYATYFNGSIKISLAKRSAQVQAEDLWEGPLDDTEILNAITKYYFGVALSD